MKEREIERERKIITNREILTNSDAFFQCFLESSKGERERARGFPWIFEYKNIIFTIFIYDRRNIFIALEFLFLFIYLLNIWLNERSYNETETLNNSQLISRFIKHFLIDELWKIFARINCLSAKKIHEYVSYETRRRKILENRDRNKNRLTIRTQSAKLIENTSNSQTRVSIHVNDAIMPIQA